MGTPEFLEHKKDTPQISRILRTKKQSSSKPLLPLKPLFTSKFTTIKETKSLIVKSYCK